MNHLTRTKLLMSCAAALILFTCAVGRAYGQDNGMGMRVGVHEMCGNEAARASNNAYEFLIDGNRIPNDLGQYSASHFVSYGSHNFSLSKDGQPDCLHF
jgi:hypothetical protein